MDIKKLISELKGDEGCVLHEYKDHLGYSTIGIGRLIDQRRGGGISQEEAEYLLGNDIKIIEDQLKSNLEWFFDAPDSVKRALANMCFQLGISGLMGFKTTLKFLKDKNYGKASENARKSLWYKQTPKRAERVIQMFTE